jgi:hypothetical protein
VLFENRNSCAFVLCRIGCGLVLVEPVAGASNTENVGGVHNSFDHRFRDSGVAENLAAEREREVTGQDQRYLDCGALLSRTTLCPSARCKARSPSSARSLLAVKLTERPVQIFPR